MEKIKSAHPKVVGYIKENGIQKEISISKNVLLGNKIIYEHLLCTVLKNNACILQVSHTHTRTFDPFSFSTWLCIKMEFYPPSIKHLKAHLEHHPASSNLDWPFSSVLMPSRTVATRSPNHTGRYWIEFKTCVCFLLLPCSLEKMNDSFRFISAKMNDELECRLDVCYEGMLPYSVSHLKKYF